MKWKSAIKRGDLLPDIIQPGNKIEIIKQVICTEYSLSWDLIASKGRKRHKVEPKQLFVYFCREFTKKYSPRTTLIDITCHIDGEQSQYSYSTAIRAINMLDNIQSYDESLRNKIEEIRYIIDLKIQEERNKKAVHI